MQRRAFLQSSGTAASGALGALALSASVRAALAEPLDVELPPPAVDVARDEAYWAREGSTTSTLRCSTSITAIPD